MSENYYRSDIDGLRAFAVMSVILFHLDFSFASGGFVGVDIFFVISGFLITRIIKREFDCTDKFNYINFYIRRIRRLFPALFVTLIISIIISSLLFSPLHFKRTGGAAVHVLSYISNFYYWLESGYFDQANTVKPFLHTWSLAIEEQFYLLWPLFFVFLLKRKNNLLLIFVLCALVLLSVIANISFADGEVAFVKKISPVASNLISDGKSTIYYLLPFRIYELLLGSILVYLSGIKIQRKIINEIIVLVGIILIGYAFFMFSRETIFPGYNALIPCIGAGFIIYSGNRSVFLSRLFSNKVAVSIGLISYSLYLVHWPMIVFWKYYTFKELSTTNSIIIIICSICIALIMYKCIE